MAAKIDEAIKAKGWKKIDLLNALGRDNQSIITKWLSGTHNFTMDTLIDLERVLDVSLLNLETRKEKLVLRFHVEVSQAVEPGFTSNYPNENIEGKREQNLIFSTCMTSYDGLTREYVEA
ncbi:MAG: multiprotein-bridging factor 1 family protein [Cyclobacteriaceae bacterium]